MLNAFGNLLCSKLCQHKSLVRDMSMYRVQITHNLNGTCVCAACAKAKNTRGIKPLVYMRVCTTYTHLSIRSICHETILLTTSSVLSFIIYACRTILGGIVTNILGIPRNTAFVTPCS